jgi:hypothetical protein
MRQIIVPPILAARPGVRAGLWACLWLSCAAAAAQQTNNNALHAVPAPGRVVIDGTLDDWDLSGVIDVFANLRTRTSYSARVAAMYDKENFYLAVLWRDPTPMHNMVDSRFDIGSGWKSDCLQLRIKTDMVIGSVDCWYSTAAQHPVINIQHGRFTGGRDKEVDVGVFQTINDALTVGAQEAFAMGDDGKSYTQEIALPWKLITGQSAIVKATGKPFREPKTYGPGDSFNMGMEFLWGPPDGRTFPEHRYADLLMPGTSSREFFWTAVDSWGPVTLEPKGNLNLPKVEHAASTEYLQKTQGPVPLAYTMPCDGFATLVIDDEQGRRVKNLIGMAPRPKGEQTDLWDGTDDSGRLMPPGTYRLRGLVHAGIDPVYEAGYGTPGVPPWETADGTGGWMSDHNPDVAVAAGRETMLVAASGCEGGRALVGADMNGRRKWGESKFQGIAAVAVDDRHGYAAMNGGHGWGVKNPSIGRVRLADGKYAPFAAQPEPQLIVKVATAEEQATVRGLAVVGDRLAVALAGPDVVRFFHKESMEPLGTVKLTAPGGLATDKAGKLYAVSGQSVVTIGDGTVAPLVTSNLEKPTGLAVDAEGKIYVADRGAQQVKVFTSAGAFDRAVGVPGGRPLPGAWLPGGMRDPNGIAVDPQGRLWVAEETMFPKRLSVWAADGTLVTDFIGPTTYGGMGACVDPDDKTRVFGNGCEYRLDYAANKATVTANLIDDNLVGELLKIDGREYLMTKRGQLYQRRGDGLVKVAEVGSGVRMTPEGAVHDAWHVKRTLPLSLPAGADPNASFSFVWSDLDDDGQMEAEECQTATASLGLGYWGGYWLDERFHIYSAGPEVRTVPLKGWTGAGAPIWDLARIRTVGKSGEHPTKLYCATGGRVIVGTPLTCLADDGARLWSYGPDRHNDVHGSHHAPIPDRDDQLFGVLSCIGTADTPVGKVFAMNSNMGRLFLMTVDGLLVGSVFQDCRIGADAWPSQPRAGAPMGGVTMGGEWFGGYFFKAKATNEYYLVAGGQSYNLIRLNGLEKLQAISPTTVTLTPAGLLAAEKLQRERAAAKATASMLSIARIATPEKLDGRLDKYAKDSFVSWKAGNASARGAVATDGKSLYLAYDVQGDSNPMVNGGQDATQLFVTGDSVDLQLGTDPGADPKRADAVPGDLRLVISVLDGKPAAVLYRWKTAGEKRPQTFTCPWRQYTVEDVRVLDDATVTINRRADGYAVEAAVPLATLGFDPQPGKTYRLDLGAIFSDATGTNRAMRMYWANKATGLVNDVPGEIMPAPNLWGSATVAGGPAR